MALSAETAAELVVKLHKRITDRTAWVQHFRAYYAGEHPLHFASAQFEAYWGEMLGDFADNWCPFVVDATSRRLRVLGVSAPTSAQSGGMKPATELQRWWNVNDLDDHFNIRGAREALVAGRQYVLVWGDENAEPIVTVEQATQATIDYDPERPGRRRAALKVWLDDDRELATLYLPDEVWKWERPRSVATTAGRTESGLWVTGTSSRAGGWEQRTGTDDDTWPIDNPLGVVPMVEFPVRPSLTGVPESELTGVTPLQDYMNLLWSHLAVASDVVAAPQRAVLGAQRPKQPIFDDQGRKVGEQDVPLERFSVNKLTWLTGDKARIDQWEAADLSNYTSVIELVSGHIAAHTSTPQHYLVGKMANLSAEALVAAEAGLVSKVQERQETWDSPVRQVYRLIALVLDERGLSDALVSGKVRWRNAEFRSQGQLVDALLKLSTLGIPKPKLWEIYGFTPSEITEMEGQLDAAAARAGVDSLAAMFGGLPTPAPPALTSGGGAG